MAIIIEAIKNSGTCDILRNVSRLLSTQVLTLLVALTGRSREKNVQQHSNTAAERRLKVLHLEKKLWTGLFCIVVRCKKPPGSGSHSVCGLMANVSMLEACPLTCRSVQTFRRRFEGRWCIGEGLCGRGPPVPLYWVKPNGKLMGQAPGFHVLEQTWEHWPKPLPSGLGELDHGEELRCLKFGGFNKDSSRVQQNMFMFMKLRISPWHDLSSQYLVVSMTT